MQYFESFPKDMFGEFPSIAVGKEVAVYFLKFFHRQLSIRTVFEESFVPFLNFGVGEFCVGFQVVQDLWFELTVLFAHVVLVGETS